MQADRQGFLAIPVRKPPGRVTGLVGVAGEPRPELRGQRDGVRGDPDPPAAMLAQAPDQMGLAQRAGVRALESASQQRRVMIFTDRSCLLLVAGCRAGEVTGRPA